MYVMAFLAAVALHGLLVLPTLYLFLTHRQLGPFFRNMVYPLSVALGTSSRDGGVVTNLRLPSALIGDGMGKCDDMGKSEITSKTPRQELPRPSMLLPRASICEWLKHVEQKGELEEIMRKPFLSATAPTLIMSMEQGLRMDPPLARFLVPVGATMNMDGTAIYFIVTVLFFAQKNNIAFTFGEHLVVG
ncbi:hypothetical protein HPB51_004361 [Rhipicephalus microplus]|uniref:Amino acid transporter n=1 Tax=Rhipicephalus microplus TaxID=6941 RepID=A0A9J6EM43_RHIMP|nr:hypothetical protein HPB51_004361 [Rhipicephalus microplus]